MQIKKRIGEDLRNREREKERVKGGKLRGTQREFFSVGVGTSFLRYNCTVSAVQWLVFKG